MRPEEKAKDLVDKFAEELGGDEVAYMYARRCALIAIEEIQEAVSDFGYTNNTWDKQYNDGGRKTGGFADAELYWRQVKEAI